MLSDLLQSSVGDFLYNVGFWVEYTLVRLVRRLKSVWRWLLRALGGLLVLALRPVVLALPGVRATLRSPGGWPGCCCRWPRRRAWPFWSTRC